jgi:hypothetical protein
MTKLLLSAIAAIALAGSVQAASITFSENQGNQANGDPVPVDRSDLDHLTDGDVSTFYSLGIGGSLTASIAPELIANASLVEVTFGNNKSFPESALVYLDTMSQATLLGELFNAASGASSINANGIITTSPNTPSNGITSFTIGLNGLSGSSLIFVDSTDDNFGATGSKDGFDIGELSITAVPLPATGLMLLAGLGGIAALRRRSKA